MSDVLKRFFPVAMIAGFLACLLGVSWLKWGNVLVDTYRDPYVVWRMVEDGWVLYKDVAYEYGFLAPYVLAGLAKVWGAGIELFVWVSVVCLGAISAALYRICRFFMSRPLSVVSVLLFLSVAAVCERFPYDMSGAVVPYSFATLFWVVFLLAGLYLFMRLCGAWRPRDLLLLGLCLVCGFLTRPWLQIPVLAGYMAVMLAGLRGERLRQGLGAAVFSVMGALAVYTIFFVVTGTWEAAAQTLVQGARQVSTAFGTHLFWGGTTPAACLGGIGLSVAATFVVLAAVAGGSRICGRIHDDGRRAWVSAASGVAVCGLAWGVWGRGNALTQFMMMSVVLPAGIVWYGLRVRVSGQPDVAALRGLALFTCALLSVPRFLFGLNPHVCYPLFLVLVVPAYAVFLRVTAPEMIPWLRCRRTDIYEKAMIVLLALSVAFWTYRGTYRYEFKDRAAVNVQTGERLFTYPTPSWDRFVDSLLAYERTSIEPGATLTVLPEGIGINYFLRRRSPTRFYHVNPVMFAMVATAPIMTDLDAHKPDYILVVQRDYEWEHRLAFWDQDYGRSLSAWIGAHYAPVRTFGQVPFLSNAEHGDGFYPYMGAVLYKKKLDGTQR